MASIFKKIEHIFKLNNALDTIILTINSYNLKTGNYVKIDQHLYFNRPSFKFINQEVVKRNKN